MVVLITGAAGSGKTTIGRALADAVSWRFVDADDYHSAAAVANMGAGIPLTDADRAPWLASLHDLIATVLDRREHLVVACSALARAIAGVRGGLPIGSVRVPRG